MAEPKILSAEQITSKDLMVMRSLIRLMGKDLNHVWELSTNGGAGDATVVDVDSEEGAELWETLSRNGQSPIALSKKRDFAARHVLHKPVRSRQLITVLNEITGQPDSGTGKDTLRPMVLGLSPDNLPLGEHLRRKTWQQPVLFEGWQEPPVIIDPGSGAWYSTGELDELDPFLAATLKPDAGTLLSSARLVEQTSGMPQRPLSDLKWAAGLRQSSGGVHPELVGEVAFMLTHVPKQARDTERHLHLARALTGSACRLEDLQEKVGEPPEVIATFLNACYCCGFLLVKRRSSQAVAGG